MIVKSWPSSHPAWSSSGPRWPRRRAPTPGHRAGRRAGDHDPQHARQRRARRTDLDLSHLDQGRQGGSTLCCPVPAGAPGLGARPPMGRR